VRARDRLHCCNSDSHRCCCRCLLLPRWPLPLPLLLLLLLKIETGAQELRTSCECLYCNNPRCTGCASLCVSF
jgi:hypothetical protein